MAWRVSHDENDQWYRWRIYGPDGFLIANLMNHTDAESRARLIAAAPTMLEALKAAWAARLVDPEKFRDAHGRLSAAEEQMVAAVELIRDALAKAEGTVPA